MTSAVIAPELRYDEEIGEGRGQKMGKGQTPSCLQVKKIKDMGL
jgi:hypothetical protein